MKFNADGFPAAEAFWISRPGEQQKLFNSDFAVGITPSPLAMTAEEVDLPNSIFNLFAHPFGGGCNPLEERIISLQGCVALRYGVTGYVNVR